jgi:hypothetical protein
VTAPPDATVAEIHDQIIARVETIMVVNSVQIFKTIQDTPMETYQVDELPALAVFLMGEEFASDGNAGEPHFLATAKFGIQAIVLSSDVETQRTKIMSALTSIDSAIMTDPPTAMLYERVVNVRRIFKYERVAETPVAQLQAEWSIEYRQHFPPFVPDDYLVLHVETVFPVGGDASSVIQVEATWDIPQN